MRRLLGLLLALVAPAQAAIHHDGFEATMPVSNWVLVKTDAGGVNLTKNGTPKIEIAIPARSTYDLFAVTNASGPGASPRIIQSTDFPTTPSKIVGLEARVSALSMHGGVSVYEIALSRFWSGYPTGSGSMIDNQPTGGETNFPAVGEYTLLDAPYIAFGGFDTEYGTGRVSAPFVTTSQYLYADDPNALYGWITINQDGYTGIPPNDKRLQSPLWRLYIRFVNNSDYEETLYIDAIDIRAHYYDASTVAMSGGGTMAVTLQKMKPISRALSGGGTIAATMNANRVIAADMAGSGRISPVLTRDSGGTIYRYLMPELSGSGTMAITPLVRYAPIPAAMSGGGTMSATLQRGHGIKASAPAAMTAAGTLAQSLAAQRPIARALSGVGTVVASVIARRPIAAALSGSGVQTIAMLAHRPVSAAMRGGGSLAVTIQRILGSQPVAASMEGSGSMSVDMIARRPVAAAMTGTGSINAAGVTINTRLVAPEGRSFYAADDAMAFIAPDDFLTFEAQE